MKSEELATSRWVTDTSVPACLSTVYMPMTCWWGTTRVTFPFAGYVIRWIGMVCLKLLPPTQIKVSRIVGSGKTQSRSEISEMAVATESASRGHYSSTPMGERAMWGRCRTHILVPPNHVERSHSTSCHWTWSTRSLFIVKRYMDMPETWYNGLTWNFLVGRRYWKLASSLQAGRLYRLKYGIQWLNRRQSLTRPVLRFIFMMSWSCSAAMFDSETWMNA